MRDRKSQLKSGVLLNYLNMGIGNLIPIFYTPIMLNLLGQNEYGLFKLSANITSYLSLISLGIGSAIVRYLIQAKLRDGKKGEEEMFGLFVIIFHIIAVVSLFAGLWLSQNIDIWYAKSLTPAELERMRYLVFILACNTAVSFVMTPYSAAVNAHEAFIFLQSMNIMLTCAGPLLNLIFLFLGFRSIGMAFSSLLLTVLARLFYLVYVRKHLDLCPRYVRFKKETLLNVLQFSFWIFVGNVVGQLYNATDTVMIGAVPGLGAQSVAIYNIGLLFNSIVLSLTIGISSTLSPTINKLVMENAPNSVITDLGIRIGRLQGYLMLLIVTGFIIFGRQFIYFYVGPGYDLAYGVALAMMIPNIIPLLQSVFCTTIIAQNRHKFRSLTYLGIAIINVIGTWILLKPMGIFGAALMTGFALFLGQGLVMNWYYYKKSGFDIVHFWKNIFSIVFFSIIFCAISLFIFNHINLYRPFYMFSGIITYTILYFLLAWKFLFNKYEKNLVLQPLLHLKSKVLSFIKK